MCCLVFSTGFGGSSNNVFSWRTWLTASRSSCVNIRHDWWDFILKMWKFCAPSIIHEDVGWIFNWWAKIYQYCHVYPMTPTAADKWFTMHWKRPVADNGLVHDWQISWIFLDYGNVTDHTQLSLLSNFIARWMAMTHSVLDTICYRKKMFQFCLQSQLLQNVKGAGDGQKPFYKIHFRAKVSPIN